MSIIRCECDQTLDIDIDDVEDVHMNGETITLCLSCAEKVQICTFCGAGEIGDRPDCPRGGICNIVEGPIP